MPNFGKRSRSKLETCHDDLRVVAEMAIRRVDFSILEGRRSKYLQNLYFDQGKSKIQWPDGKHNCWTPDLVNGTPIEDETGLSNAMDIAPYPIDWADSKRFILLAGVILGCAHALDIPMRWGGWWQRDLSKYKTGAQNFNDLPHFELD